MFQSCVSLVYKPHCVLQTQGFFIYVHMNMYTVCWCIHTGTHTHIHTQSLTLVVDPFIHRLPYTHTHRKLFWLNTVNLLWSFLPGEMTDPVCHITCTGNSAATAQVARPSEAAPYVTHAYSHTQNLCGWIKHGNGGKRFRLVQSRYACMHHRVLMRPMDCFLFFHLRRVHNIHWWCWCVS